jgi:hypothetical protein
MKCLIWLVIAGVVLALSSSFAVESPKKSKGIFSGLKVGQNVSLKDEGARYSIDYFDTNLLQTHKVVAVADDFVVIRDINDLIETTVPVYSIKSVSKLNTKPK